MDDNPDVLAVVRDMILEMGYSCRAVSSGEEALEQLAIEPFTMLITDEAMPGIKGSELVSIVHDRYPDIPCLVISGHTNMEAIVSAMSEHKAFNYLFKPLTIDRLSQAIDRAFEYAMLQRKAVAVSKDEHNFFKTVLDTFNWKEALRRTRNESLASDMINQINIGFFQGNGIGMLISTLSMLFEKSKKISETDTHYLVRDVIFEMARDSFEMSLIVIENMARAQSALTSTYACLRRISGREFFGILQKVKNDLTDMLGIKHQRIFLCDIPPHLQSIWMDCDPDQISTGFRELCINAMKYSQDFDIIYVLTRRMEDHLEIKVLNPAYEYNKGEVGICGKYENLVFEPFFRMSKIIDERYMKEDLSYGLGLPVVKKIVEQHNGSIFIYTLDNHMNGKPEKDICVSMHLPLHCSESENMQKSGRMS